MKSKATTYLLFAIVLVIWGVIVWKLFSPSRKEAFPQSIQVSNVVTSEKNDTLKLNYVDPFLKKHESASTQIKKNSSSKIFFVDTKHLERSMENCPITYIGYMHQGRNHNGIIKSNGIHHSITTGDIVHGFRLVAMYPDSLIFIKDGLSYTINLVQ